MRSPKAWLISKTSSQLADWIEPTRDLLAAGQVEMAAKGIANAVRQAKFLAFVQDDGRWAEALWLAGRVRRAQRRIAEVHRLLELLVELGQASENPVTLTYVVAAAYTVTDDTADDVPEDQKLSHWLVVWQWCVAARAATGAEGVKNVAALTTLKLAAEHVDAGDPQGLMAQLREFARWLDPESEDVPPPALLGITLPELASRELFATAVTLEAFLRLPNVDAEVRVVAGVFLAQCYEHSNEIYGAYEAYTVAFAALPADSDPLRRAALLHSMADCADRLGRYGDAYAQYRQCLRLRQSVLPPKHGDVLQTRHNLAELLRHRGDTAQAGAELAALAAIYRQQVLNAESADTFGWVLVHLAQTHLDQRQAEKAAQACAEGLALAVPDANLRYRLHEVAHAAAIAGGGPVAPSPEFAAAVAALGVEHGEDSYHHLHALAQLGAFTEKADAEAAHGIYTEILDRVGGRDTGQWRLLAGSVAAGIAGIMLRRGDTAAALEALNHSFRHWLQEYASLWQIGSATGDGVVAEPWPLRELAVDLARVEGAQQHAATALAFQIACGGKGLQAEAVARQRDAIMAGRDDLLHVYLQAAGLRRTAAVDSTRLRDEAGQPDISELEEALARQVPPQALRSFRETRPAMVAEAVPPHTTLVEYVRLGARYVAFILPAASAKKVTLVYLGEAGPIDEAVSGVRLAVQARGRGISDQPEHATGGGWQQAAQRAAALIWTPVAQHLADGEQVIIAPDGPLYALPFDVLPEADGSPLLTTRIVSQVATGRDLRSVQLHPNWKSQPPLVIAAPEFGPPGTPFADLPGAAREGREVAEMLEAELFDGPHATRELLLDILDPEILHLATHGFGAEPQAPADAGRPADAVNPLTRSGLAFAGANSPPGEGEPGVVTALDVLGLLMFGTDLVVLSSCESGLGPATAGEGLASLARSFLLAGARSAVWSLWRVDDEWTRRLMRELYTKLLAGAPRAAALSEAKREVYAAHPDRPELWASFVVQGDPQPLLRFREADISLEQIFYGKPVRARDLPESDPNSLFSENFPDMKIMDKGSRKVGLFRVDGMLQASINMRGLSPEHLAGLMRYIPDQVDAASAENAKGRAEFHDGNFEAAYEHHHRALTALNRVRRATDDDQEGLRLLDGVRADTLSKLALCAGQLGRHAESRDHYLDALALYQQAGIRDLDYAIALENLGICFWNLHEPMLGIPLVYEALAIKLETSPENESQLAFTRQAIAFMTDGPEYPQTSPPRGLRR